MRIDRTGFIKGSAYFLAVYLFIFISVIISRILWPDVTLVTLFPDGSYWIALIVIALFFLVFYLEFGGVCVRRLHDLGYSWLPVVLLLIPLINIAMIVLLAAVPGERKTNAYGPPPTSRSLRAIFGFASN